MRVTSKVIWVIGQKYLSNVFIKHFYSKNALILYIFHLYELNKIKLNSRHLNFYNPSSLLYLKGVFYFISCFEKLHALVSIELSKFKMS